MLYQDLIGAISDETKYTRREIRKILRVMARIMREELSSGRDVQIYGVGKWHNKPAAPKEARNARTGERIRLPARRRVKFTPCEALSEGVRASVVVFHDVDLQAKFGLKKKKEKKEPDHGKVWRRYRSEESSQGEEGG
jgi:DNA-binding protein HU-beta